MLGELELLDEQNRIAPQQNQTPSTPHPYESTFASARAAGVILPHSHRPALPHPQILWRSHWIASVPLLLHSHLSVTTRPSRHAALLCVCRDATKQTPRLSVEMSLPPVPGGQAGPGFHR